MVEKILNKYGVKQLGYYVESVEESAGLFFRLFGAGPFIDMGINEPASCKVRGVEQPVRIRAVIGYLGDMEIELIEDCCDCPTPYKEAGSYGLHHFCIWVDDVDAAVAEFEAAGMEVAMDMTSGSGLHVVYIDAVKQLGQYIEINPPLDQVAQMGKGLNKNWTEDTALISIQDVMKMMGR